MRKISIALIFGFLCFVGCSNKGTQSTYPNALMWKGASYSPGNSYPIDEASIDSELGKITKQVQPMPKKDGEVNYLGNFTIGNKIFSIKTLK